MAYIRNAEQKNGSPATPYVEVVRKVSTMHIKDKRYALIAVRVRNAPRNLMYKSGYCTVDCSCIDAQNKLTRALSLAEMCYSRTVEEAVETRVDHVNCEGMSTQQIVEYYKKKIIESPA